MSHRLTKDETNRRIIKLARRQKFLSCTFCPPNKNENGKKHNQFRKKHQCWKFKTKVTKIKKQYDQQ